MRKHLMIMLIVGSFLTTPAAGLVRQSPTNPLGPGDYTFTIQSGGLTRAYDLHIPGNVSRTNPVPLVVDIHPYTATKEFQAQQSDFKTLSNANGFVVAYPQGINNQWNAGDAIFLGDPRINDVAFIRAMVAEISSRVRIDRTRVYATGHSNGSMLTHRIGCEAADLFAGIAGMSGGLQFTNFNDCRPSRPISVKIYHGYNDTVVPYFGGLGFEPIRDTFEFWVQQNRCSGAPQITTSGRNRCETYTNCANGTQVSLCSLVATHFNIYDVRALNVSSDAWSFFRLFRLPTSNLNPEGLSDLDQDN